MTDRISLELDGPVPGTVPDAQGILRSLPRWFGVDSALLQYAQDTQRFPTFWAAERGSAIAFLTLREHFPASWEVHCVAVHADARARGVGRRLHRHAERWLYAQGARYLQVKTVAAGHPSPEYAQTRAFYTAVGYAELEVFAGLWRPGLPVLQMIKVLHGGP
jgi:GNAT superfamily N-acetyltransferase